MKPLKALMLHSENSGVGYYRIWQQAKWLKKLGWDVTRLPDQMPVLPNDDEIGDRTEDKELMENYKKHGSWESISKGADILVYQRPDEPQTLAMALAMRDVCNAPVVFEIDDNVFDVAETNPSYKYWYPGSPYRELAEMFMRNVDAITVTTPALKEVYSKFNDNVIVLPNCQDPDDWDVKKPKPEDKLVIGWAGSSTHYDDLKIIRRPLKKFLRNYPNAVFRVLGTLPDFLKDIPGVEFRTDWVHVSEWQSKLAELNFDIGLVPVVQRPFNEGKSNIKWQEYSMLEVPTIASRVGEYKEIEHGVTGFLAGSEAEWYHNLTKLADDAQLRKTIGKQAKQYTLKHHNISKRIQDWDAAYRTIIDKFHSTTASR